jgi:catechol 2,3-dioxygenase-like lactoylglutathione lyase family enzyme
MARIRHIALTTKNPSQTAEFYKQAFGLKELRRSRNGAVFLMKWAGPDGVVIDISHTGWEGAH